MSNELGHTTFYEYNLAGSLTKVVDPLGNETHYTYDVLNQLTEIKQLGKSDDANGVSLDLINSKEVSNENRVTTYNRNLLGQIESITDALGNIERYKYSPIGQLIEKIDKDGFITKYGYTSQGDVDYIGYADGKEVFMSYNPLRQLTEVKDWLGVTSIEVDPLGRAIKVINHRDEVIEYTYGKAGERRSITYPDGKVVNYHYDEALRLTQIQGGEYSTNYIYDEYSRLVEKQYPNNVTTKYGFDELNRLQSLVHSKSGKNYGGKKITETLDQFYYKYDLLGNKTEINKIRSGKGFGLENNGKYSYQYDKLNRLTQVMKEHDLLRSYQYDAFGNRKKMIEKGKSTSYTYNNLNQLISSHDSQGVEYKYLYDNRGNLTDTYINDILTNHHYFGALNYLESTINYEKNQGALYDYDGLGNRLGKKIGSLENSTQKALSEAITLKIFSYVKDVIDPTKQYNNLLKRTNVELIDNDLAENKKSSISFLYDFGVLSAITGNEKSYYFNDDLNSPMRLVSECGYEKYVYDYDEFGNSLRPTLKNQPFEFAGYQYDSMVDAYTSPTRVYNPSFGRFISVDSYWHPENMIFGDGEAYSELPIFLHGIAPDLLAIEQSRNLYNYAIGNPQKYVDPRGTFISKALVAGAAIVGGIVGGAVQVASNVTNGESWYRGVVGAVAGGATFGVVYTATLIKTKGNTTLASAAASYSSAAVRNFVNACIDIAFRGADPRDRLEQAAFLTAWEGTLTWFITYGVGKMTGMRTVWSWTQPRTLKRFFTGNYGQRIIAQTGVTGLFEYLFGILFTNGILFACDSN